VTPRALFGGYGLYLDGRIFAIIAWNRLYFRTDARTKEAFRRAGGEPFVYQGRGGPVEMPYSTPPPDAVTTESLLPWAERGVAAAGRVAQTKRSKRR
jgi:DNA transformation protein